MSSKLKILLIVGIVVLVSGIAVSAAGVGMGGVQNVILWPDGPKVIDADDKKQVERVDETFANVQAIDIDLKSMDHVVLKRGSTFSVKGQNLLVMGGLKAALDNSGTLTVTNSVKRDISDWVFFNIDFDEIYGFITRGRPGAGAAKNSVEITVPENTSLTAITLDLSYGDVTLADASSEQITVTLSTGNVDAKNLACDSFNIDSSYGDINMNDLDARDVLLNSSAGTISLTNVRAPDGIKLHASYGTVDLKAVTAGRSEFNLSSGDFTADDITITDGIRVDNSYGNINIEGDVRGESRIEAGAGDVDVELYGAEEEYYVIADVSVGNVTLGDRKFERVGGGNFESGGVSFAPNQFSIDSSYGDVKVTFWNAT
ncbi:MAG: DUF4097 domain-containing protein [Clostridiales Family XIII bacterium]|nr:DUF4097 domain-containing protein [Clostridiales Family XIII bacterium]